MNNKDSIFTVLDELTEQGILSPASAGGERYIIMRQDSIQRAFPLYGKGFELALKQLLLRKYQIKVYSGSVVKTNFYAIYNESGECMFCS